MALDAGQRLGAYEILDAIGAGGMGEVYRARDTRLNRDVAIKVASEKFSERFEREARAIAALNHPNICTLYDVGPNFLVMELVEGESPKGPMPFEEALTIARQVASALEAAHEQGIVHRDLKPGNIKVKPDGTVKVLDFGLAKVGPRTTSVEAPENSPTISMAATQAGMILGTAAYMSPEQARGKNVDKRADIWAFGVVLYELLTGKRLFEGEDLTETLAAVVKEKPDLSDVPVQVRRVLERCLEKDPKKRLRDISGVELLLEQPATVPQAVASLPRQRARWLWPAVAGVAIVGLAVLAFVHVREKQPVAQVLRYVIEPTSAIVPRQMALSPDGRHIAMIGTGERGVQLWTQALDALQPQPLPGSNGASYPFWSPDGRQIGFFAEGKLKKIAITGGPAISLCNAQDARGGSWNQDGVIIFATVGSVLKRVGMAGGEPVPLFPGSASGNGHRFPQFLPDGRHFVYLDSDGKPPGIYLASLDANPASQNSRQLLGDDSNAQYVPPLERSSVGHLLFVRQQTLMAQPVDSDTMKLSGDAFVVAEQISRGQTPGYYYFSVSGNGILVHQSGASGTRQDTWLDRNGKPIGTIGGWYTTSGRLALSPDGTRLVTERDSIPNGDLWITELDRATESRLTLGEARLSMAPVWSPDGTKVVFAASITGRNGVLNLYQRAADGTGQNELLLESNVPKIPTDSYGQYIVFRQATSGRTGFDLFALPMSGDKKPIPLLNSEFNEVMGTVSPDGRWLAYASDKTGIYEVYVRPFAPGKPATGEWQVSLGDGRDPHWRGDSRELFFVTSTRKMMAVDVRAAGDSFVRGTPRELFAMPYVTASVTLTRYAVTKDGQRFMMAAELTGSATTDPIYVTVNWLAGISK
jgi:Tol biopolymer transport system component/predicted Ser/Thr protein kinase